MSTPPRNLPRFLPTLTEIVHLPAVERTTTPVTPDLEATVSFVMQRVDSVIERRLREETDVMLRNIVTEQLQSLGVRLRHELDTVVRQAVSEAMTSQLNQHKLK